MIDEVIAEIASNPYQNMRAYEASRKWQIFDCFWYNECSQRLSYAGRKILLFILGRQISVNI